MGAVILHSPLMSGMRVAFPKTQRTWCFDAFPSIDKVSKVTSPVLVIHGTEDEVIDFSHGIAIHDKCPKAVEPLWVEVNKQIFKSTTFRPHFSSLIMKTCSMGRVMTCPSVSLVNWNRLALNSKKQGTVCSFSQLLSETWISLQFRGICGTFHSVVWRKVLTLTLLNAIDC